MGINIQKRYPSYIKEFKCIGGACEDSCCIGWDVDIDKVTFKQYYKVKDQDMKRMFQKNIHNNEYCQSDNIDYGKVKLKSEKRCPFLDKENYCVIHSKLGEEYLSNVCTSFPRVMNKVDGVYEASLDPACPEAARLMLLREEGISFEENKEDLGKHIISSDIDTKSKTFNNSPIKYFKEIREISIKIMKNRKFNLSERLYILGDFISRLEEEIEEDYREVSKFIKKYDINLLSDYYEKNKLNYVIQMDFFKKMIKLLDVFKTVDSISFKEHTKQVIEGFNIDKDENISENSQMYINEFEDYAENFIDNNSYIFENYLVNLMYKNMFPFSESESMFDGYMMLVVKYSFIRFYLVGKYIYNKEDKIESVVEFIQSFSKAVEHHKTYLVDVLNYLKQNEFDNIEFAKVLL